ncbi:MAG: hypothetical protein KF858_04250 [Candidatus Sumerlaeia bacterium]|nr:hypothetical protein [Candidatus Sumerlaeia bacterium]
MPRAFFLMQVGVGILLIGTACYLNIAFHVHLMPFALGPKLSEFEPLLTAGLAWVVLCGVLPAPFFIAANLLAFSSRWSHPERLGELVLTHMTNREMAFGSIFWATVTSCIMPACAIVGGATLFLHASVLGLVFAKGNHLITVDTLTLLLAGIVIVGGLAVLAAITTALKVWFLLRRTRWPILLLGPLAVGAWGGCASLVAHLGIHPIQGLVDVRLQNLVQSLWVVAVAAAATLMLLRAAGRFAPSLFVRSIDPEPYRSASVVANIMARAFDRDLRHRIRQALRKSVPRPTALAVGTFGAVVIVASMVSIRVGRIEQMVSVASCMLATSVATFVIVMVEVRHGRRVALVGGALDLSLARRLIPIHAALAAVAFGWPLLRPFLFFGSFSDMGDLTALALAILKEVLPHSTGDVFDSLGALLRNLLLVLFLATAHVSALASVLGSAGSLVGRWTLFLAVPCAFWVLADVWHAESVRASHVWMLDDFWDSLLSTRAPSAIILILCILLVVRLPRSLQRLHDATTRRVQPGEVVWLECDAVRTRPDS